MSKEPHCSAVIQLVGIKDLAEDDPVSFSRKIQDFLKVLKLSTVGVSDVEIYTFRDYAYFQSKTVDNLVSLVRRIRLQLLKDAQLYVRGAMIKGALDAEYVNFPDEQKRGILQGFEFNNNAALLFGEQEKLKGIGISAESSFSLDTEGWPVFVKNYYVSEASRRPHFVKFNDLNIDKEFMTDVNLDRLLRSLKVSSTVSRKFASFFVPILLLWAKATSLREDEKTLNVDLDERICAGELNRSRNISGIELIFLVFLNKVFADKQSVTQFDAERVANLQRFFKKSKWIHSVISSDNSDLGIPNDILSGASKREFAKFLHG